jgi:glycosyltransferase involved in cell wall biosynthesis
MRNLKTLVISPRIPYPVTDGMKVAISNFIRTLRNYSEIHLVVLDDRNEDESGFKEWVGSLGIGYKIFRLPKWKSLVNTLAAFLKKEPLQVGCFWSKKVYDYIASISKEYDIIIPITIRTAKYVNCDSFKVKWLFIIDSIAQNYIRSLERTHSLFWKLVYSIEKERLLEFERKCISIFDKTIFVNKFEMEFYKNPDKTFWLPNAIRDELLKYNKYDEKYKNWVVFFGRMKYQPNIDAVLWFINNVLPRLDENIKFAIVGSDPSKKILKLQDKYDNIIVTGFVDDPYVILRSALCVVAPMQTGGGIQNKVLEAMAVEGLVIVSSLSAKPIGAEHMKEFIVEDDPMRMASIINDVYHSPSKYITIRQNARKFIKSNFSEKVYKERLNNLIRDITIVKSFGG